jgi:hypothetical protein
MTTPLKQSTPVEGVEILFGDVKANARIGRLEFRIPHVTEGSEIARVQDQRTYMIVVDIFSLVPGLAWQD